MILTDCHVHSQFSSDSKAPVEAMLGQAIQRGFPYFYLTDHMDYEFPTQENGMDFLFDPEAYFPALEQIQKRNFGKIQVRPSIEIGLKPHLATEYRTLFNQYPFDFVIGSTHLVKGQDPYLPSFWEGRSEKEALSSYFEAVIENIRAFPEFDSCGHLDYAIRYAPSGKEKAASQDAREGAPCYRYADYSDYLDKALELLIHHGIALEVNTAGYAKGLGQPNPQTEALKRYRELGGELLTIGSDAHVPNYYGYGFARVESLLKSLGYQYYAIYRQRKPEMVRF